MFGLFESPEKKLRESAANWLELADKVWHFRRDVLPERDAADLKARTETLRSHYKAKAAPAKLTTAIEALEPVLKRTGGEIYPKTALVEYVEFFLVAAIVIIGVRTYFVQPFKIPTNSMWPSYYGMTPDVYVNRADEPGKLAAVARTIILGAWPHRLNAPGDGEVLIPLGSGESPGIVRYQVVPGRSWLVFPTTLKEYTLLVDDRPVKVRVPLDFDFDWAIGDVFFATGKEYNRTGFIERLQALIAAGQTEVREIDGAPVRCVRTGRKVRTGERILAFDEVTGDQLFVDRVSNHFVKPKVGQGFVFFTGNIPGIRDEFGEQYYIKRLVGVPGDTLQIKPPVLLRNGAPISGALAFEKNAQQSDRYLGYVHVRDPRAHYLLADEDTLTVPPRSYFAMGDNSNNSFDGRYWGFVPAKEVIGRPLFIYFPFSRRWGPTH